VQDTEGGFWRSYLFIENTHSLEFCASPIDAHLLGRSIACFQFQLADMPGPSLHEVIPDFHNMETRYRRFFAALSKDACGRVRQVREEIDFFTANEERGAVLIRSLKNGAIPERICHNDAKINNILLDDNNSRSLCVIDLDTVMSGTSLFDSGDLIRTVANRAKEDEQDPSKVEFALVFFEALLDGYLSGTMRFLTSADTAVRFIHNKPSRRG
jgi:Ser/Thr protein kinase RdoA (MazF antagonist)